MKRCLEPGCSALTAATRCGPHARAQHRRMYSGSWARLSRALRTGARCSSCGTTEDLTLDHVEAGSLDGGVAVLCRECNSRKGAEKFGLGRGA